MSIKYKEEYDMANYTQAQYIRSMRKITLYNAKLERSVQAANTWLEDGCMTITEYVNYCYHQSHVIKDSINKKFPFIVK